MIKPGSRCNEIIAHNDRMPTLLAAAGVPDIKERLLKGYKANGKTFKAYYMREDSGLANDLSDEYRRRSSTWSRCASSPTS